LLQRIVGLFCHRLGTEEKVVAHHRPNPWNITRRKQDLPIIPAEDLIPEIQHAAAYVDPHESEVPLQRAAQPVADGESLGPVQQIFLRDFCAETWKRAKDLQPAAY